MSSHKKEIIVVEPTPADAAKKQFIVWRDQHPDIVSKLGPQDVIVDVIRAAGGRTLHQYRVFVDDSETV